MRDRWASLLAVDDVVGAVYDRLAAADALATTYFFYSSDHGYKLGQWRVGTSKQHPYDTDVRVPFLVRGPGIAPGRVVTDGFVVTIDLAPTFLDLAGAKMDPSKARQLDGIGLQAVQRRIVAHGPRDRILGLWQRACARELAAQPGTGPGLAAPLPLRLAARRLAEFDRRNRRNRRHRAVRARRGKGRALAAYRCPRLLRRRARPPRVLRDAHPPPRPSQSSPGSCRARRASAAP